MSNTITSSTEEKETIAPTNGSAVLNLHCYVAGKPIESANVLEVRSPYDNRIVGTVALAGAKETNEAIEAGLKGGKKLSRYERYSILDKTRHLLMQRKEEI